MMEYTYHKHKSVFGPTRWRVALSNEKATIFIADFRDELSAGAYCVVMNTIMQSRENEPIAEAV